MMMSSMSSSKFTTIGAAQRLMKSMELAIDNMIDEVKRPVDPEGWWFCA